MMSSTFGLFFQVSASGPHGPLVDGIMGLADSDLVPATPTTSLIELI